MKSEFRLLFTFATVLYGLLSFQNVVALNLRDFPEDVLAICFEELDIPTLLNVVEYNKVLLPTANWGFRVSHADKTFNINTPLSGTPNKAIVESSVSFPETTVRIEHFETGLKLLNHFGSLIKKIAVQYIHMNPDQRKLVNGHISNNCTQLETLHLINAKLSILEELSVLPTVKSVAFTSFELEDIGEQLLRVFPNMTQLEIKNPITRYPLTLARHFPSLVHLDILFILDIEATIKANRQIRSVSLTHCASPENVQIVNDNLPNIETLALIRPSTDFYQAAHPAVHFESVKRFHLFGLTLLGDIPISFNPEKLEEIKIQCSSEPRHFFHSEIWRRILFTYTKLVKLELELFELNEEELMQLVRIPSLKEIGIEVWENAPIDAIVNFVGKMKNLNKFRLIAPKDPSASGIKDKLEQEWDISLAEHSRSQILTMKRKIDKDE